MGNSEIIKTYNATDVVKTIMQVIDYQLIINDAMLLQEKKDFLFDIEVKILNILRGYELIKFNK